MKVREWEGEVVFLHEVAPGAADRSYGIQVAQLAGLPDAGLEPGAPGAGAARTAPSGSRRSPC